MLAGKNLVRTAARDLETQVVRKEKITDYWRRLITCRRRQEGEQHVGLHSQVKALLNAGIKKVNPARKAARGHR